MPSWVSSALINLGVWVVETYGVPFLESKFSFLTPLLQEILALVKGASNAPSPALRSAADHYVSLSAVANAPVLKSE